MEPTDRDPEHCGSKECMSSCGCTCSECKGVAKMILECPIEIGRCTERNHVGLEKAIGKLGMGQPLMPDPELGQDVAFLAHVITEQCKQLEAANLQVRDLQENVRRIAKGAGEEWMKRQLCTLVESFAQKQEHETNWADTHRAGDNDEQPTKARCECCPKCGLNIPGGCPVEDHAHAWCKCVEKRKDGA